MPRYHYKSDGTLDMRYSSSKAAVASGSYSRSSYGGSSSRPSSGASYSSGGLHLKKDGTPDMRYSSSRAAVASGSSSRSSYGGSSSRPSSGAGYSSGGLHFKKDGTLDMRYSSSKAAVASDSSPRNSSGGPSSRRASSGRSSAGVGGSSGGLHLKKDGTPDMRYKSSHEYLARGENAGRGAGGAAPRDDLVYKKDGTLDMRYKSSREFMNDVKNKSESRNPSTSTAGARKLHFKKDGTLDMRYNSSQEFLRVHGEDATGSRTTRRKYNKSRLATPEFKELVCAAVRHWDAVPLPAPASITVQDEVMSSNQDESKHGGGAAASLAATVGQSVPVLDFHSLDIDETKGLLGEGAFGKVFEGKLPAPAEGTPRRDVAVKKLHLESVGRRRDKSEFIRELKIMAKLGQHPNIIELLGYCEKPPAIIMERAHLGSLNTALYHAQDDEVESNMMVGTLRKRIACQVADGLRALHQRGMVHRDVKPDNGKTQFVIA